MTDDIATLKEQVNQFNVMQLPGQPMAMHMGTYYLVNKLWRALSRRSTPPLPEKIAGLIERHAQVIDVPGDPLSKDTIVALRALALEIERLNQDLNFQYARCVDKDAEIARLGNLVEADLNEDDRRLRTENSALAQENERLKNPTPYRTELRRNQRLEGRIRELEAENKTIRKLVQEKK